MALTITKAYADGSALLEAHLDNFRTGLLDLLNVTKLSSSDITGTISATILDGTSATDDDELITFGTGAESSISVLADKTLRLKTATGNTFELKTSNADFVGITPTAWNVYHDIGFNTGQNTYGLLYLLSRYRKPVLVYEGTTNFSLENNTGTAHQTLLCLPSRPLAVTEDVSGGTGKFRIAGLSYTANGYASNHTGAAQGGVRVGLTLSSNSWYYVYGARVRYGSDAGNTFIMVVDDTAPTSSNTSTLNSRYGTDEWVYLGMIRRGYGATGSSTNLIPWYQSNKGWCRFVDAAGTVSGGGLVLYYNTSDSDGNPAYTIARGESGAVIPSIITLGQFAAHRSTYNTSGEIRNASDKPLFTWPEQYIATAGNGILEEIPVETGTDFTIIRQANGGTGKGVSLTAFYDPYITLAHGRGI